LDKTALVAAQAALTSMGLTQRVGETDLIALYQAWATEQVANAINGLAAAITTAGAAAVADNKTTNGMIQQTLDEVGKVIATIPPVAPAA
jgi:hypothetical protein